jgi:signal transduction histidine kinase
VLQILVNLFRNAREVMAANAGAVKTLAIEVRCENSQAVQIKVQDNGAGITPEDLTRIFRHGFTTKPNGHGFGLHSGALAAKEMGGSLQAFSAGRGAGATFVLELPAAPLTEPANPAS